MFSSFFLLPFEINAELANDLIYSLHGGFSFIAVQQRSCLCWLKKKEINEKLVEGVMMHGFKGKSFVLRMLCEIGVA